MNKQYGKFCADGATACEYLIGVPYGQIKCFCSKFNKQIKPYRSIFVVKCSECVKEDKIHN